MPLAASNAAVAMNTKALEERAVSLTRGELDRAANEVEWFLLQASFDGEMPGCRPKAWRVPDCCLNPVRE